MKRSACPQILKLIIKKLSKIIAKIIMMNQDWNYSKIATTLSQGKNNLYAVWKINI